MIDHRYETALALGVAATPKTRAEAEAYYRAMMVRLAWMRYKKT